MGLERWRRKVERTLRVGSVASIAFAPYVPANPQPQGGKENLSSQAQNLVLNTLKSENVFKDPITGSRIVFEGQEAKEQAQSLASIALGAQVQLNRNGNLTILSETSRNAINIELPPAGGGLETGRVAVSPNGSVIAVARRYTEGRREKQDGFLVWPRQGRILPLSPDFFSRMNYTPLNISLRWSPDSKKIAVAGGQHGGGKTLIFDVEAETGLFELENSLYGEFSPNSEWFAKGTHQREVKVANLNGEVFTISGGTKFAWSPDSRHLAVNICSRWIETAWGDNCQEGTLGLYNIDTRQLLPIARSDVLVKPLFSPGGDKILFGNPADSRFRVYEPESQKVVNLDLPALVDTSWSEEFHESGLLVFSPPSSALHYGVNFSPEVFWADPNTGELRAHQRIQGDGRSPVFIKGFFKDYLLYQVQRGGEIDLYRAPITIRNVILEGEHIGTYQNSNSFLDKEEVFGIVKEGDLLLTAGGGFLYQNGKARKVEHEETVGYFAGQENKLPEILIQLLPEGEAISFLPGDVVGHEEIGIWYLRNGKRYRVQNWDWFKSRQKFDRGEWPVARELIERIPVGEVPRPAPGETGIRNWDGTMKEFQPFGGRMIIYMGGHGSNSSSQTVSFEVIKEFLRQDGWNDNVSLEGTYSLIESNEGFFPVGYSEIHTYRNPQESIKKVELLIQWYKERFPLTKFILVGHSLGGFILFNSARAHVDAVETVVTLDSPLKGIDRVLLTRLTEAGDELIARGARLFSNSEVGRYLADKGDDEKFGQEAEVNGWYLVSHGVRLITATNKDDIFIPEHVAVLENSRREARRNSFQLVWELGRDRRFQFSFPDFLDFGFAVGHGQILEKEEPWGSFLRIIGSP